MKRFKSEETTKYTLTCVLSIPGQGPTTTKQTVSKEQADYLLEDGFTYGQMIPGASLISWTLEEIHTLTTTTVLATEKGIT